MASQLHPGYVNQQLAIRTSRMQNFELVSMEMKLFNYCFFLKHIKKLSEYAGEFDNGSDRF